MNNAIIEMVIGMYAEALKKLRKKKNLEQKDIANLLGISETTYCDYENDIIPLKHLNRICGEYSVSFDYIFEFSNKINYKGCKSMLNRVEIGKRLKAFRKENKITQLKLVNELHIANGTISGYEHGQYLITTHTLYAICKKYKISADYLLAKIDSPKYLK